jgi:hypothetical protein
MNRDLTRRKSFGASATAALAGSLAAASEPRPNKTVLAIGFEPNAFVDITKEWQAAMAWLGGLMAFVQQRPYDPKSPEGALATKEVLARYRGLSCGVKYAEAVWAAERVQPREIL